MHLFFHSCSSQVTNQKNNDLQHSNFNLSDIVMPVHIDCLAKELHRTNYDRSETKYLIQGFTNGFDLGYEGSWEWKDRSENIPLSKEVGTHMDLWEKIMKEDKLKRFSGPYREIPYQYFVQSPVGLVPRAGNQSRLIFHLSYDFKGGGKSINFHIPDKICTVKYRDLDHAVESCLKLLK